MTSTRRSPRVVVLGGWSAGPLLHLKRVLSSHGCMIVEPTNLPMPPIPGTWCCNPIVLLMFTVFVGLLFLSCGPLPLSIVRNSPLPIAVIRIVVLAAALVWFRLLAAAVVRTSIDTSIRLAETEIIRQEDPRDVLMIGFSWGGAVRHSCLLLFGVKASVDCEIQRCCPHPFGSHLSLFSIFALCRFWRRC
jgi:hypothetical protein